MSTEKKDKVKASKVKGGKASKPKSERLKANILDAFKKKGAYIFFCGREYNKKASDARIKKAASVARSTLRKTSKPLIDFYDANRIASWVNEYFAAVIYVLEECGEGPISGLQTWDHWSGYEAFRKYSFITNEELAGRIEQLRAFFLGHSTRQVTRMVGLSGLGKRAWPSKLSVRQRIHRRNRRWLHSVTGLFTFGILAPI